MRAIITLTIVLFLHTCLLSAENNESITMEMIKANTNLITEANLSIRTNKAFNLLLVDEYYLDYESLHPKLKLDKDIALAYVQNYTYGLSNLNKKLLDDNHFILLVIEKAGTGLAYATREQRANKKLVLQGLRADAKSFKIIDRRLKEDEEFIKEILKVNGLVLEYLDKKYRANRAFVSLAIKNDSFALAYASNMLQSDEELIKEAVEESSYAFEYAHPYLKQDKKYVMGLLKEGYEIIDYVDEKLQVDQEVLDEAIKHDTGAWKYFDENLTQNSDFIIKKIKENFLILMYVDEKFTKDKELITLAVKKNVFNLAYADDSLKQDKDFLWGLIEQNSKVVEAIDETIWKDNAFLLKVLKRTGFGLQYATKEQQNDIELVVKALKYDGYSLEFANERFKKSKIMLLLSLNKYAYPLIFADESLKSDKAFIKEAIKENSYALLYASEALQVDKELARLALKQNVKVLEELKVLKKDKAFISTLLEDNLDVLPYVSDRLKNDSDLIALSKKANQEEVSIEAYLLYISIVLLILFFYFKLFKKEKRRNYLLGFVFLLLLVALLLSRYNVNGVYRMPYVFVDKSHKYGLEPVDCNFSENEENLNVECYNVHVPEIYNDENSRVITFPLRIFRSSERFSFKSPVLHLGAGGPGANMGLDSAYVLDYYLKQHDDFSINQGRDLFMIDPRGAGLSKPLLNCETFASHVLRDIKKNLTLTESYASMNIDYETCIKKLKKEQVNFNGYNSLAVSNDINLLRKFIGVDKFILFGVSYSTTYAMFVAKNFPHIVEKMILDSACFPDLKLDHNYVTQSMDMYNALYDYKKKVDTNDSKVDTNSSKKMESTIWTLQKKLNEHPVDLNYLELKLNGDYFIESLLNGVYATDIFKDLPKIVEELESNKTTTFLPYFKSYLDYLMNKEYADISVYTHYCYEDKPFIDFQKIREERLKLKEGYIRQSSSYFIFGKDFCKEMEINSTNKTLNEPITTEIPTLFIHGEYDSVTPLRDVKVEMKRFKDAELKTYKTSHAVLGTEESIEKDVAEFVGKNF